MTRLADLASANRSTKRSDLANTDTARQIGEA